MRLQPCDLRPDFVKGLTFSFDGDEQPIEFVVLATNGAFERVVLALQFTNVGFEFGYGTHGLCRPQEVAQILARCIEQLSLTDFVLDRRLGLTQLALLVCDLFLQLVKFLLGDVGLTTHTLEPNPLVLNVASGIRDIEQTMRIRCNTNKSFWKTSWLAIARATISKSLSFTARCVSLCLAIARLPQTWPRVLAGPRIRPSIPGSPRLSAPCWRALPGW